MISHKRLRFGDKTLLLYSAAEVETFLRENPEKFSDRPNKLIVELLVGAILARELEQHLNVSHGIGFVPNANSWSTKSTKPSLVDIVARVVPVLEHETDIYIVRGKLEGETLPEGKTYCMSPVQVTRFCSQRDDTAIHTKNLCELMRKKCRIQTDDYLQLVILIDSTFDLDEQFLFQEIKKMRIPYVRIYLIGQGGNPPSFGRFQIREIYPERGLSSEVQLNLDPVS
jgi:hypothetical protein